MDGEIQGRDGGTAVEIRWQGKPGARDGGGWRQAHDGQGTGRLEVVDKVTGGMGRQGSVDWEELVVEVATAIGGGEGYVMSGERMGGERNSNRHSRN